ncbi:hypothetical protein L6Q79_10680 [bacterium]|nr:hypothetical protein [bacterium]NUN45993.1 hypothetical protein [bacterium]HMY36010.1 hypothetical protein [bacterium]HNB09740.1 hypothetical protein [bacterium]HNB57023.1 hypothetical protein [bacterium]
MIMIDSDIFIMDNFYTNDPRYETNSLFLHRIQVQKNYTTIFNLLEVCSLIAPHCTEKELLGFYENFDRTYNLEIIHPSTYDLSTEYFLDHFFGEIMYMTQNTGNILDAMMFTLVRQRTIRLFVSWNAPRYKKMYAGRFGKLEFLQPDEYMKFYKVTGNR